MAIDFDELNNFLRKSPMILSQADVLDWSETMTNDVKTKIHDGLKAGVSYEDINNSLDDNSMDVVNTKFPDKVWMVDETFSTLHLWIYNYELDCHLIVPDYEEMMDDNLIYYTPSKMADDVDCYRLMQDSAMFHDWQRSLDKPSRKVLNLPSELEDGREKEF